MYEGWLVPIKERVFAKPCILWSPLPLKCYLQVFIICAATIWHNSPNSLKSLLRLMTFFHKKVFSRFIGVSSLTKDCRLSVFWSPDWVLLVEEVFILVTRGGIYWLFICFHTNLVNLCWSVKVGREAFSKRRTNIDLSTVGRNKKVFIGCSSLDTKFPTRVSDQRHNF